MHLRKRLTMRNAIPVRPGVALPFLGALIAMSLAALPVASSPAATTPPEIVAIPPASASEVIDNIPLEDFNLSELAVARARFA